MTVLRAASIYIFCIITMRVNYIFRVILYFSLGKSFSVFFLHFQKISNGLSYLQKNINVICRATENGSSSSTAAAAHFYFWGVSRVGGVRKYFCRIQARERKKLSSQKIYIIHTKKYCSKNTKQHIIFFNRNGSKRFLTAVAVEHTFYSFFSRTLLLVYVRTAGVFFSFVSSINAQNNYRDK